MKSLKFYGKLAWTNLRNNKNTYFPYMLTCVVTIMMFYCLYSIATNEGLQNFRGGTSLQSILSFGIYIIAIFAIILLFYVNSFLIKRRQKEFGLYSILGMEKKHVSKVLFVETITTSVICLVLGLGFGVLFSKLLFLALTKLIGYSIPMDYTISADGFIVTAVLFLCIFGLTFIYNYIRMRIVNPINLLKGGQVGEKEPKASWILTIIAVICLGIGYYIAISNESPLQAIPMFFFAVLLVIIGTYCLFISGTIAVLKFLKKRKKIFYKPQNFISVSGMIYRMKQNATGLASICILSTMVLVVISATVSLNMGREETLNEMYPTDLSVNCVAEDQEALKTYLNQKAYDYGISLEPVGEYRSNFVTALADGSVLSTKSTNTDLSYCMICVVPLDDFNKMENTNYTLESEDEVLLYCNGSPYNHSVVSLDDHTFQVKQVLDSADSFIDKRFIYDCYVVAVKDVDTFQALWNDGFKGLYTTTDYQINMNLKGDEDAIKAFADSPFSVENARYENSITLKASVVDEWMGMNGGFLFLGLFFGALFTMATALIIYYKQISEGYDDHDRFHIMQKVGMSKKEVRKTINKQILMVFFMPLLVAVVHIAFAFKLICSLLLLFGLTNTNLFLICTIATIVVFAVVYAVIYKLTARTYYRLVD